MPWPIFWITSSVFALTYLGLAVGRAPGLRLDRAGIALVGAVLMLVLGCLTLPQAVGRDSIDYDTIFLLFGMMVVVASLRLSGFFVRLTNALLGRIQSPTGLLAATILLSGLLSAFLVNDVVCVALTPLVLHLARRLRFDPLPHLIGLATAANIGSTATITGNPQNMIIGSQSHIPYLVFFLHLAPVAVLGLGIDFLVISKVYRRHLVELPSNENTGFTPTHGDIAPDSRAHRRLLIKSVGVTALAVLLFFTGLPIALVALGAAGLLMVARIRPEKIYRQIDWRLLVMFMGLFIVVHAFELRVVSGWGVERWGWLSGHPVGLLSLMSAGLSNLVSNVPAVLLFEPVMRAMPAAVQPRAWLALAMSSTLAGNLTVVGSVANLIVVESARRQGVEVSFREYCLVGVPVTVLTLGTGMAWLIYVPY